MLDRDYRDDFVGCLPGDMNYQRIGFIFGFKQGSAGVGISPGRIHRHTNFPIDAGDTRGGNGLFRRSEIALFRLPRSQAIHGIIFLDIRNVIEPVVRDDGRL
jgi:hypothetical protein